MSPATTARRGRCVLTPLARKLLIPSLRTGRREVWDAVSVCGRWRYERVEIEGTPWVVTFAPTGQEQWFGSLPRARRWTASPDALPHLRRVAQDVVDRGGFQETVRAWQENGKDPLRRPDELDFEGWPRVGGVFEFEQCTVRDMFEALTGRSDLTDFTREHVKQLHGLLFEEAMGAGQVPALDVDGTVPLPAPAGGDEAATGDIAAYAAGGDQEDACEGADASEPSGDSRG